MHVVQVEDTALCKTGFIQKQNPRRKILAVRPVLANISERMPVLFVSGGGVECLHAVCAQCWNDVHLRRVCFLGDVFAGSC